MADTRSSEGRAHRGVRVQVPPWSLLVVFRVEQPNARFRLPLSEETVAKVKGERGFRFIKELGGAIRRETVSKTARFLAEHGLLRGRVLDYGCGFGLDADHFGWEAYDPVLPPEAPGGTVRHHRVQPCGEHADAGQPSGAVPGDPGSACLPGQSLRLGVAEDPEDGKIALRKRIQNYVVLTLPSVFRDDELEIYRLEADSVFEDRTQEIEDRL